MANNATFQITPISNGTRLNSVAVTPGATIYNPPLSKLWVGVAGNVTMVSPQNGTVTLTNLPVGWVNDVAILQVTAGPADLIGFF